VAGSSHLPPGGTALAALCRCLTGAAFRAKRPHTSFHTYLPTPSSAAFCLHTSLLPTRIHTPRDSRRTHLHTTPHLSSATACLKYQRRATDSCWAFTTTTLPHRAVHVPSDYNVSTFVGSRTPHTRLYSVCPAVTVNIAPRLPHSSHLLQRTPSLPVTLWHLMHADFAYDSHAARTCRARAYHPPPHTGTTYRFVPSTVARFLPTAGAP